MDTIPTAPCITAGQAPSYARSPETSHSSTMRFCCAHAHTHARTQRHTQKCTRTRTCHVCIVTEPATVAERQKTDTDKETGQKNKAGLVRHSRYVFICCSGERWHKEMNTQIHGVRICEMQHKDMRENKVGESECVCVCVCVCVREREREREREKRGHPTWSHGRAGRMRHIQSVYGIYPRHHGCRKKNLPH